MMTPPSRVAALLAVAFNDAWAPPGASTMISRPAIWPRVRKAPGPTLTVRSLDDGSPLRSEIEPSACSPPASALSPVRSIPSLAKRKPVSAFAGP